MGKKKSQDEGFHPGDPGSSPGRGFQDGSDRIGRVHRTKMLTDRVRELVKFCSRLSESADTRGPLGSRTDPKRPKNWSGSSGEGNSPVPFNGLAARFHASVSRAALVVSQRLSNAYKKYTFPSQTFLQKFSDFQKSSCFTMEKR